MVLEITKRIDIEKTQKKFSELKLISSNNQNSLKNSKLIEKSFASTEKNNTKQLTQINTPSIRLNKNHKRQQQKVINASTSSTQNTQNKNIRQYGIIKSQESTSSTTTSNDEFETQNNIENKNSTKFVKRRVNYNTKNVNSINNNEHFDYTIVRKNKRGKNRHSQVIPKLLSNSTSTCSLVSSASSSSGFGTGESSNGSSRAVNNELLLNETKTNESYTQESLKIKREDLSPSISVSSTLSSIGFGDYQESAIGYLESNQCVNNNNLIKTQDKDLNIEINVQFTRNCDETNKTNNFESVIMSQNNLSISNDFENQSNANMLFYNPFLLNNFVNDANFAQYYGLPKSQNFNKVSSLLSNPNFEKFFNDQKQYYRKIYDQQFAACRSTILESNSVINPTTSDNLCQETAFDSKDGISYRQNGVMIWRRNGTQKTSRKINAKSNQKEGFNNKNYYSKCKRTSQQKYYLSHQHLGFPICLPYTALDSWQELGLNYAPCNNQWQQNTESSSQYIKQEQQQIINQPEIIYSPSLIVPAITPFNPYYFNNQLNQNVTDIMPVEQNIETK